MIPIKKRGVETGQFALCSKEHYEELMKYNWCLNRNGHVKTIFGGKQILMNFYIWTVLEKKEISNNYVLKNLNTKNIDNKLDNRIENIGIVTRVQSSNKKRKRENVSSTLYGVRFNKKKQKFHVSFQLNGTTIHLGFYNTEKEAGMVYDTYIVQNNLLEQKVLNFETNIEYYKTCKSYFKQQKKSNFNGVQKLRDDSYRINVKGIHFSSKNEKECALKYDELVVKYKLDRKLNFPENYPNYKVVKIIPEYVDDKTFKIKFKNGKETFISSESYDKIKYYRISVGVYVKLKINGKNVRLSRFLMDETNPKVIIDHEDGDVLNNRLENLRRTDSKGNCENKTKKRKTKDQTNYIGVYKIANKFRADIKNGNFRYRRNHKSEEHAARDRDLQIMKNLPNSLHHLYFKDDWKIPGEIEKWESILYGDSYWLDHLFD
jgi:hypothetical protein